MREFWSILPMNPTSRILLRQALPCLIRKDASEAREDPISTNSKKFEKMRKVEMKWRKVKTTVQYQSWGSEVEKVEKKWKKSGKSGKKWKKWKEVEKVERSGKTQS